MEIGSLFANLALGFSVAVTLQNLFWCLMGAVIGTAIGVLPGVGPVATMALLLPVTYFLPPEGALIMLAGIYYGAQYGGSTTAILVNLPGEASSVVTTLDGYQMARQGRAGPALAIAAIGSFFAGCVATIVIAVAAPPLTKLAQQFAPADYFSLMVLGLVFAIVLARGSVLKAFGMIFLGMLLGLVGTDVNTGNTRFTFGIGDLFDGIGFVPLAMGVFGIAEIIANLTNPERRDLVSSKVSGLMPTREDLKRSIAPILRGTVPRRPARHPAGRRRGAGLLLLLHLEKKLSRDAGEIRHRHDRGRGRARERQQRRRADLVHSHADARHPVQRRDGDDDRRHDDPRHRPGAAGDGAEARPVLGHDRQHVARQPDAGGAQPAADRHLGADAAGALPAARRRHPVLLLHRRLQPQQLRQRGAASSPSSACVGYLLMKLECEPAPLLLGFLLGPHDGGLHAPRHAAVARRPAGCSCSGRCR